MYHWVGTLPAACCCGRSARSRRRR
jgi:hypothetical protein